MPHTAPFFPPPVSQDIRSAIQFLLSSYQSRRSPFPPPSQNTAPPPPSFESLMTVGIRYGVFFFFVFLPNRMSGSLFFSFSPTQLFFVAPLSFLFSLSLCKHTRPRLPPSPKAKDPFSSVSLGLGGSFSLTTGVFGSPRPAGETPPPSFAFFIIIVQGAFIFSKTRIELGPRASPLRPRP